MAKIKTYPTATPATDDKILFTDVSDVDNTKNATVSSLIDIAKATPRSHLYMYVNPASPVDTDIVSTDVTAINMTALVGYKTDDFTLTEAGVINYTGAETKLFSVTGVIELSGASNNNEVSIFMRYNGSNIVISKQTLISVNGDPMPFVGVGAVEFSAGDNLYFVAQCTDATDTVTLDSLNVVFSQL